MTLKQIKEWAEEIESSWNGKESGIGEDRAMQARDILESVAELERLISEMNEI